MRFSNSLFFLFHFLLLNPCFKAEAQQNNFKLGVVLCGSEFGEKNLPGIYNTDYTYPTLSELIYFKKKGFKTITIPFKWERVQKEIGGNLDSIEMSRMKSIVGMAGELDLKIIFTLQNFAVYQVDGKSVALSSKKLSNEDYHLFWKQFATVFNSDSTIYGFDIMNEPRGIFGRKWRKACQAAIDGIRSVDVKTAIIIDGENSSFTLDWSRENTHLRKLNDPSDNIIYDAHCYFDFDHSGRYKENYQESYHENIGIERVKPFIKWLKKYHKHGMIGEFGVPSDKKWLVILDKFLAYIKEHNLEASYWAAGPWWNNYPLSIEPKDDEDKPQMKILEKYLEK